MEWLLEKISHEASRKRPEENLKFIFKRAIKSLRQSIKAKSGNKKIKKKEIEQAYLVHYFKEASESMKIPLSSFLYTKGSSKSSLKNFAVPKTINNQFVAIVFKSDKFVADFKEYTEKKLKEDYRKIIHFKLGFLVNRWQVMLREAKDIQEKVREICNYVEKNRKCKLPWNFQEIDEAKEMVLSMARSEDC